MKQSINYAINLCTEAEAEVRSLAVQSGDYFYRERSFLQNEFGTLCMVIYSDEDKQDGPGRTLEFMEYIDRLFMELLCWLRIVYLL